MNFDNYLLALFKEDAKPSGQSFIEDIIADEEFPMMIALMPLNEFEGTYRILRHTNPSVFGTIYTFDYLPNCTYRLWAQLQIRSDNPLDKFRHNCECDRVATYNRQFQMRLELTDECEKLDIFEFRRLIECFSS